MKGVSIMIKQERAAYWRSLVSKQIESGLAASSFCREHQFNRDRFYHWRRRSLNEESSETYLGAFEQCFEETKAELGVDNYEVKKFPGRQHHMPTCILAHFFLWHLKIRMGKRSTVYYAVAA